MTSGATAANVAVGEGWELTSGLNGGGDSGYTRRTAEPRLKAGFGPTEGMTGSQALYVGGYAIASVDPAGCDVCMPQASFARNGGLERHVPLAAWRGQRLRLSLRLKNDGGAISYVGAQIDREHGSVLRTSVQINSRRVKGWLRHSFVLDVPMDARDLVVVAGLAGEGTAWLDDFQLDPAPEDARITRTARVDPTLASGCDDRPECQPVAIPVFYRWQF